MPNLRIVADNAAERATLTASTTSGALAVTNLQTDDKSAVWRATGTTASIRGVLPAPEIASCAHLPYFNGSPTATMRVRLTSETTATNLLQYSEQFDNAAWVKTGAVAITADNGTAPDILSGADTAAKTGTSDAYLSQQQNIIASATHTFSVFVAKDSTTSRFPEIFLRMGVGVSERYVNLNTATGATAVRASTGVASHSVVNFGTYWRVTITCEGSGATTTAICGIRPAVATTIGILDLTATGSIVIWGAQLEAGTVATSYYKTTSAAATRPLGYIDTWQTYALDTGVALACPAPARRPRGFTTAQAASAYANGGGAHARAWFAPTTYIGFCIDIVDTNNLQGAVEAVAAVVIGRYWELQYNASAAPLRPVDSTEMSRNGAGGLMRKAGTIHREVEIDLRLLSAADRTILAGMLMSSRAYPILLSAFPGHPDLSLERDYTIYGCIAEDSEISIQYAGAYASKVKVVEI